MTGEPRHILLVEDDALYAEGIAEILRPDFEVTVCSALADAIALLAVVTPDLILLDLRLPDSDEKHETTARLSGVTRVPIVAWSSCGPAEAPRLRARVQAAGGVDLLVKGEGQWGTREGRANLVRKILEWIEGGGGGGRREEEELLRILIIEDEPWAVDFLRLAAAEAVPGSYCDSAASLPAAIEMLRSLKYLLVILDLNIIGSSGLKTLDRIGEYVGLQHVLVVTGQADLEEGVTARQVKFLAKPFYKPKLVEAIREVAKAKSAVSLFRFLQSAGADLKDAIHHEGLP